MLRAEDLDIDKSHGAMRTGEVVAAEAAKADRFAAEKKMEEMTAEELMKMGLTRNEQSNYEEAQKYLQASLEKTKSELPAGKISKEAALAIIIKCLYGLANCARELGNTTEALEHFNKSLRLEMQRAQPDNVIRYELHRNIGITYLNTEEYLNAAESFRLAIAAGEMLNDRNRVAPVKSYHGLALVLSGEAKMPEGLKILREAREMYPLAGREDSMDWAAHRYHTGRALEASCRMLGVMSGKYLEAHTEYAESVRLRTQITSSKSQIGSRYHHSRLADPKEGLYRVSLAMGFKPEAKKHLQEAIEHYKQLGNKQKKVAELEVCLQALNKELEMKQRRGTFQIDVDKFAPATKSDANCFSIKPN